MKAHRELVTLKRRNPKGICSEIQEVWSKEVLQAEGRGVNILPTTQRSMDGGAESDQRYDSIEDRASGGSSNGIDKWGR